MWRAEVKQQPFCISYMLSFICWLTLLVWNSRWVCNCSTFPWILLQLLLGQVWVCWAPWLMVQAFAQHPHQSQRPREWTWASTSPCGLQPTLVLSQFIPTFLPNCLLHGHGALRAQSSGNRNKDNSLMEYAQSASMIMSGGISLLCVTARNPASLNLTIQIHRMYVLKRAILFLQLGRKYSKVRGRMYCRKFGKYLYKDKN